MTELRNCVLIVEDEYLIAEGIRLQVEDMGLQVCGIAGTAESAIELAEAHRPSVILMDMRLRGDRDGVEAALAIHEKVGSKVIFVTGSREPATLARIEMDHPAGILFKPLFGRQLQSAVERVMGG